MKSCSPSFGPAWARTVVDELCKGRFKGCCGLFGFNRTKPDMLHGMAWSLDGSHLGEGMGCSGMDMSLLMLPTACKPALSNADLHHC